tara:strand:- start:1069 stop:2202 length:1134 start_codon:yes stop_codon:yes gene_type:complete
MADTAVEVTAGTGTNIDTRTEATNGNHRQVVVLGDPATNAGVAPVDATAGLKVDLGADNDISGTVTAELSAVDNAVLDAIVVDTGEIQTAAEAILLDTAAIEIATEATQAALETVGGLVVNLGTNNDVTVTGSVTADLGVNNDVTVTGTVDLGATDNAVLDAIEADTTTLAGAVAGTEVQVDVVAALPAGTNAIGKLAANSGVDIGDVDVTSIPGIVGTVAHDAADSGAPVKTGGRAVSAEIAAVANNDRVDSIYDLVGKQIVLPYANPENFVSGTTSAMTGTTSTSLVAAPASGLRNYITTIIVSNAHGTVGTDVVIQDGSGGTTLLTIPAAAVYGGAVINLPVPLRQPTTATAIFCANVTTGASTKVSAVGYKGA